MANPKCGSCRFFQESDLPGCGWCQHPQRKTSSDLKILVRRSELRCRDDWSRSLWQPIGDRPPDDNPLHRMEPTGPVPPASPESLRTILAHDAAISSSEGEDVLLSEARIISEPKETWEPPARSVAAGNFDARTAIFRARELHLQRLRANAAAARQLAAAAPSGGSREPGNDRDEHRMRPDDSRQTDAPRNGVRRPGSEMRERADTVNESAELRSANGERDAGAEAALGDVWGEPERAPERVKEDAARRDRELQRTKSGDDHAEVCLPEPSMPVDETAVALNLRPAANPQELPAWFRTDLPRVCRTCRDFRPGTDGQRGWCGNAWAFTHRQLVQEDDAAPCHSAIGDWWVPVDDVWLVAADVSTHGRATPLLDRRMTGEAGQRRRS